jgi:arylsulfatase A-like enzyme
MYARHQSGAWLLYDLENDPAELHNLVSDPSTRHLAQNLDARLLQWMKKVGDSWSFDWTAPVMDDSRLYQYRTFSSVPEYLDWAKRHPHLAPGIH